jgi:hypothetical protein
MNSPFDHEIISPMIQAHEPKGAWFTCCIFCHLYSKWILQRDDLILLAALKADCWKFVSIGDTYHAVCPACAADPTCTWDGEPVAQAIARGSSSRAPRTCHR